MVAPMSSATNYTVGDKSGWTRGANHNAWASAKSFLVGDSLVFNYVKGQHTMDEVSASGYKTCTTSKVITSDNFGATPMVLKTAEKHYFICGVICHYVDGMKLSVTLKAALLRVWTHL
ncbi:hypothetical protein UlMin_035119 [Ulmus minor]